MQILHLNWINTEETPEFFLWAESPEKISVENRPAGNRHPFCAEKKELAGILKSLDEKLNPKGRYGEAVFSLPAPRNYPLASFQVVAREGESVFADREEKEAFSDFRICGMWIDGQELLPFLVSLVEVPEAAEMSFGHDVHFWSRAAKFALELLAQQRFLPSVREKQNQLKAIWKPVINRPQDETKFNLLIQSMPAVCRAYEKQRNISEKEIILNFLDTIVDRTVRGFLNPYPDTRDNLVSEWLRALTSEKKAVNVASHQKKVLKEGVENWIAAIENPGQEHAFRTCFRLENPAGTNGEWKLSFYLQGIGDRSLLIPAEEIWQKGQSLTYLAEIWGDPQRKFLEDLARATRLFPLIETSLNTPSPTGCGLNIQEAYSFLKEGAYLLQESGYGVLVPAWWEKRKEKPRLGLRLSLAPESSQQKYFDRDNLVKFNWKLALGDDSLSPEELERLVRLKAPMVNLRGEWIEVNHENLAETQKYLQKISNEGLSLQNALRIGLGYEDTGLPVVEFAAKGWLQELIKGAEDDSFAKITVPTSLKGKLRPYQELGFSWLAFLCERRLGGCLADDMGLGKTVQFISLVLHHKQLRKKGKPVLVVCPTSVVGNWQKESAKFAPSLKVMVHHGGERLSGKKFLSEVKKHDLVISTYALILRDQENFKKAAWEGVVLDEAQKIKNPKTRQAQAVRSLQSEYRMALTGTPIENRLIELWSIMEFLNPGYLGSQHEFKNRFAIPIERYASQEHAERLRRLIQPFILRRVKTDKRIIKDLPEKNEIKTYCSLTKEQVSLYQVVVDEMLGKIENSRAITRKGLILAALTKLKQICNHPALFLHDQSLLEERSGKLTRLTEMLEEVLAVKDKALIFTQFSEMGHLLKNHLQKTFGRETLFLHGGVARGKRDLMVQQFQESDEEFPFFVLSLRAGGLGLNLTRATVVFHFDRWWNPAVENQATDRTFRIGQTRNVQVYKYICPGTLEERIDEMIEAKKGLADKIIEGAPSWLTELSNQKLRDMFTLRKEALP